jgi:hypothetical protein
MHNITTAAVAFGVALLLGLAGASPSFAKAHDQGVADTGSAPAGGRGSQAGGTGVGGQGSFGVSEGQRGGARGTAASSLGSENSGDKGIGRSDSK